MSEKPYREYYNELYVIQFEKDRQIILEDLITKNPNSLVKEV